MPPIQRLVLRVLGVDLGLPLLGLVVLLGLHAPVVLRVAALLLVDLRLLRLLGGCLLLLLADGVLPIPLLCVQSPPALVLGMCGIEGLLLLSGLLFLRGLLGAEVHHAVVDGLVLPRERAAGGAARHDPLDLLVAVLLRAVAESALRRDAAVGVAYDASRVHSVGLTREVGLCGSGRGRHGRSLRGRSFHGRAVARGRRDELRRRCGSTFSCYSGHVLSFQFSTSILFMRTGSRTFAKS